MWISLTVAGGLACALGGVFVAGLRGAVEGGADKSVSGAKPAGDPSTFATFELASPSFEQLAKRLGYSDLAVAQREAALFFERVQGGYLPNRWLDRCRAELSPQLCVAVEDYFTPALKKRAGGRGGRRSRLAFNVNNVPRLQGAEFQTLLESMPDWSLKRLRPLAERALKHRACPRNFSLALARAAEKELAGEGAFYLMTQLDAHGMQCLAPSDPAAEYLYLRTALFRYARGAKQEALEYVQKALDADNRREEWRSLYWAGRIAAELGQKAQAAQWRGRLQVKYPLSWHSVLARKEDGRDPFDDFERNPLYPDTEVSGDASFDKRFLWARLMLKGFENENALNTEARPPSLGRYGEFLAASLRPDMPPGMVQSFARQMNALGQHRLQIVALNMLLQARPEMMNLMSLRLFFPRPFYEEIAMHSPRDLDLALLLGLARQESSFDAGAVSAANARGLFQVLPRTARSVKRNVRLDSYVHNIEVGSKYLLSLLKVYDGSAEKALAAYNAGRGNVKKWQSRYGFVPASPQDAQLWVDLIPYRETRDYVAIVLRNAYWYHRLYPDLNRGLASETYSSEALRHLLEPLKSAE